MVPSTIYCDVCGAANRPEARFCFSCGEQLHSGVPAGAAVGASLAAGVGNGITPNADADNLKPEMLLRQRYRIVRQLGQGGFGAVYQAEDSEFGNRLVAVKEMSQKGLNAQETVEATEAFKREALLLGGLMHPNLPRIYDHFFEAGHWYLVMDFIEGETLEDYLKRVSVPLKVEAVLDIGLKLCTVLDYLHHRQPPIIFRDLKPANIMLTADDNLYLIDFGIARHFKPGQARDTVAFGSPGYAAPEQYGLAQTTPRSDIYSLGAILHQLLSGRDPSLTPFRFQPLNIGSQFIPPTLDALLQRMLEIDEHKRPATMAEVKQELQFIAAHPHALRSSSLGSPIVQQARQQPLQGTIISTCHGHTYKVIAIAWSPDGTRLVSASETGEVRVWEAMTGNTLLEYLGHTDKVSAVAWSPDGTRIASASKDRTAQVWDAGTGKLLITYRGHASWVSDVTWSPDGRLVASCGGNRVVYIWNAHTGFPHVIYNGHDDLVYTVAWSPDGRYIASAGGDRTVQVWDSLTGRKLLVYRGHSEYDRASDYVHTLAWSPDGMRIASISYNGKLLVWEAHTGANIITYGGQNRIAAVVWWPNGQYISTSNAELVQVWDVATWSSVSTYHYPSQGTGAVAWSADRQFIASSVANHDIQIWQCT